MKTFKEYLSEGGNVFAGKTASIKLEHIKPTLDAYFAELKQIFPKKASIFNDKHFVGLGSVGKKPMSGDIDLGIDAKDLLDHEMSDKAIALWNIDPKAVHVEFAKLEKRARSANPEQLLMKAFLKELTLHINSHAPSLYCDEKKVTNGNIFGLFPQINEKGEHVGIGVQIDWMVGDLQWLSFSYHSSAYPANSNVKGLHRTQLLLSTFQAAGLSFNHVSGVKDKETGEVVATNPADALKILSSKLKTKFTQADVDDYYKMHAIIKKLPKVTYDTILDTYLKILDSTRCDVPDDLQAYWLHNKNRLGLTGKFLPAESALNEEFLEEDLAPKKIRVKNGDANDVYYKHKDGDHVVNGRHYMHAREYFKRFPEKVGVSESYEVVKHPDFYAQKAIKKSDGTYVKTDDKNRSSHVGFGIHSSDKKQLPRIKTFDNEIDAHKYAKQLGLSEGLMNRITNKIMGVAPEKPAYKVGQYVHYEMNPPQKNGKGSGKIDSYSNGHYMVNGMPVNHHEIEKVEK